jgi:BirA family transcriptional regulator, biotin operon repressor / biotin---[acetyl-CoA-carboxylase] ligase
MSDLTEPLLAAALAPRAMRYTPTTGSTNDDALTWLANGAPAGAVVITDEQLEGRGRLGRTWFAPPGSALLCSVIVRPPPVLLPRLTMVGALAVLDMAESYAIDGVGIKWPNDVLINGRKLSGVLPEAAWQGDQLLGAVVGMGVNLNIPFIVTPLAEVAISISDALGAPVDRLDALTRLLAAFDARMAQLDNDSLFAAWKARLVTLGQRVTIGAIAGVAEDVQADGALLVKSDDGALQPCYAGDVGLI